MPAPPLDTSPVFEMSRCPKTLQKRATLTSAIADAERVQTELSEILADNDVRIIDLSRFPGDYKSLVCLVSPLVMNENVESVVVASELRHHCRTSVNAYLVRLFAKTNAGTVTILGATVSLSSLVNFSDFTRKIVSPDQYGDVPDPRARKRVAGSVAVAQPEQRTTTTTELARSRKVYALRAKAARKADGSDSDRSTPDRDRDTLKCYVCHNRKPVDLTMDGPGASNDPVEFYKYTMCPKCAKFNFEKRLSSCNLEGGYAVVTGGRIKIGFEIALKLLRDGCYVVATTRFADDASKRYEKERDFEKWKNRLKIYQVDFRDVKGIYGFTSWCKENLPRLDVLINNAAQTIDRPEEFYQHMLGDETQPSTSTSPNVLVPAKSNLINKYFPAGCLDEFGQQVDLRRHNSWSARLQDVPIRELLQVFAINAVAPFILVQELNQLMSKTEGRKFVVNVSAMEGQFSRLTKTERHPHTNMAKAALNMFTRTTGMQLATDGIYMTAVDTGWVTDERPHHQAKHEQNKGFVVPLDCVDGASRVYDPIVRGLTSTATPDYAVFLKDYKTHAW